MSLTLTRSHVFVDSLNGFAAISDPSINLVIWRRRVPPTLERFLDELAPIPVKRQISFDGASTDWPGLLGTLLSSETKVELHADMKAQADRLAELFPKARMEIKLQSVAGNLCERFHVDWVPLRLLCTYVGPAAEWLDNADVDRTCLDAPPAASEKSNLPPLRSGGQVRRLHRFDVALMKGDRWPGVAGKGLVHRSPRLDTGMGARLLFKIDVALHI